MNCLLEAPEKSTTSCFDSTTAQGCSVDACSDEAAIMKEFEKAAIDQVKDEKYWEDLMSRAKSLNLITDKTIAEKKSEQENDLFAAVRANKIDKVNLNIILFSCKLL